MPTPPGEKVDPKSVDAKAGTKAQVKKTASGQVQPELASEEEVDPEEAKRFVCKDNIEKDKDELANQIESSWAQREGFPAKSGQVMAHSMRI